MTERRHAKIHVVIPAIQTMLVKSNVGKPWSKYNAALFLIDLCRECEMEVEQVCEDRDDGCM